MRLSSATENDVVRNTNNGSFYRFARPERSRARIRPLELFPNGRLIPKSTDTLVDSDLDVALVGPWHDTMVVEGRPSHTRVHYESELSRQVEYLAVLEIGYDELPVNGTGKLSRGSWANKIKNCRARIEMLTAGLADPDGRVQIERAELEHRMPDLEVQDVVLLPAGRPGLILDTMLVGTAQYATVQTRLGNTVLRAPVPMEVLRPWAHSHLCSI